MIGGLVFFRMFMVIEVIVNDYDLLGIFVVDVNVIDVDVIVSI